jgi:hypothetical protein
MGIEAIAGIAVTVLITVAGWVWRLSGRLTSVEAAATRAEKLVGALDEDLKAHKDHVAAEYVSRDALKEVTDAINRLGDRLDNLFLHFMSKASHD